MKTLEPITLEAARQAQSRLKGFALRSPLVRLTESQLESEIYLKLENLQPTGSFKLRGAGNAVMSAPPETLNEGVWTASAGNMGLNLAWFAQKMGVACRVIVPDNTPAVKEQALKRLGAQVTQLPFSMYQGIQRLGGQVGMRGRMIHPFADAAVMAGNATLALEIFEDLPDVEAILVPYGGGGLSCGIAAAMRQIAPQVKVFACEVETGAPLAASLAEKHPVETPFKPSFVSGMGAPFVFPQMWPLASQLLAGSLVVTLEQVCQALRLLAKSCHVVAEGAGAVSLAAALYRLKGFRKVACIVSGGNIDSQILIKILQGNVPV